MKLTIDRAKWRTGRYKSSEKVGSAQLLNREGFMCCLGFLGLGCGFASEELEGNGEPADVAADAHRWPESIVDVEEGCGSNTDLAGRLMEANDSNGHSDESREADVRELMDEGGIAVDFVGEYPELDGA